MKKLINDPRKVVAELPNFFFKPESGIKKAMDAWLKSGGTHHQVLNLGLHARGWRFFAEITGTQDVAV